MTSGSHTVFSLYVMGGGIRVPYVRLRGGRGHLRTLVHIIVWDIMTKTKKKVRLLVLLMIH